MYKWTQQHSYGKRYAERTVKMSLIVKICVIKLGVTKTFKFSPNDRVEYVISQVQEKTAGTQAKPNENFGIFYKDPLNEKKSFWMLNSRTLKFYDVESGTTLLYKDKNRYLKVKMLDKTIKTVLVDDSKSVGHALDIICQKIGITNNDEFALFIEEEKSSEDLDTSIDDEKQKTNTIRRVSGAIMKGVDSIEQRKVEKLKEKAHTDDDTNWLSNEKTLREAGVQDDTLVVIRRRFTFEQSVNITNPIEIALLYAQSTEAILDGSHPCDLKQAAQFSAYMIQVQHGDFDDTRYRSGQVDPKEYLPKEYQKNKEIVKKIKEEHKKLSGLNELDAKYKYIQLCQNLKTYGVTFFIVKEVVKGKNKLQPVLFGVCKESVMKVDEKTKQIIKEWPLTTIKNWAASPNSFTLDFGGYQEGMYSVQTNDGAQIGQLIGGYIDIIMKRMKKIRQKGYNDDELGMISEDTVMPSNRHVIQNTKFIDNPVTMPKLRSVGQVTNDGLTKAQKTLVENIDNSGRAMLVIMDELEEDNENPYAELEPIRQAQSDDFKVENVLASISTSLASISYASAVTPEELDYTALNDGITKITSNMTNLAKYLKFNAKGLGGDTDGKDLISAARNLSDTFKGLLHKMDPQKPLAYEETYNAMNVMADASISIESVLKKRAPDAILKGLVRGAQEIERATVTLADHARQIAVGLDDSSLNKIQNAAKHVVLKAQGMVVAAKVMAPYLHRQDATEQFSSSIRNLSKDIRALSAMCLIATNDDETRSLIEDATRAVAAELGTMLQLVQSSSVADVLMVANEALLNSIGNPAEMKDLSTLFTQAYSRIVKGIQANADAFDGEDKEKLLNAVRDLSKVLELELTVKEDPIEILQVIGQAAEANLSIERILKKNNETAELQNALLETVDEIYDATKALEEDAVNVAYLSDNEMASKIKEAASRVMLRSTALVTSAKIVAPYVESPEAVKQMVHAAKVLSQDIKNLTLLCEEASKDQETRDRIDDKARVIVEGLGRMLKLFQEGVIPENIPKLLLEVNDRFLKSIGEPEDMRRQCVRFDKPYSKLVKAIPERVKEFNEEDGKKLIDAAKALSDAMKIVPSRQNVSNEALDRVEKMADSGIVFEAILKDNKAPVVLQKALLQAAEGIENAVEGFESQIKKVLNVTKNKKTAEKIATTTSNAILKGRGMVVGVKVISPYVKMSDAIEQMNDYTKAFSKDIIALRDLCQNGTDSQDMKSLLHGSAEGVTNALNTFLKITQNIGKAPVKNVIEKDIFEVILEAQQKLNSSQGKADEMVKQATILGQVYSQLIRTMQAKSDLLVDSDEKENLRAAAAELSDATTELIAAAKRVKDNPKSKAEQDKLIAASIHLEIVTNSTTDNALKKAMAVKLEITAKQASAAMTRLIGVGKHTSPYNTSAEKQKQFNENSEKLIVQEGRHLIHSVKESEQKQGNPQALLQLINASRAFVTSSVDVINLAKENVKSIANSNEANILGQTAHSTESIINSLSTAADRASGDQEEFDRAVNTIQLKLVDLDQAMLASMTDNLKPNTNDSIKSLEEKITNSCNKINDEIPDTVDYSHNEPEKIGGSVLKLSNLVIPLSENVIAFAANLSAEQQHDTLNRSKAVFQSTIDLVNASKLSCGLPEEFGSGIQEAADNLIGTLKDLLSYVKMTSNEIDAIHYLVSNFDNLKSEVDLKDGDLPGKGKSFAEYQDKMVKALKTITRDAHDMVAKGQTNPNKLSGLCEDLYENYSSLVEQTKYASILAGKDIADHLRADVKALGDSCKQLVKSAGVYQISPNDYFAKTDLSANAREVSSKVAMIMSDLQKGSVGTQACINAINTLSGLLGDIDTTVMFAHAGTLDPEDEQSFGAHRETILWSSQKLVKDTKQLVEAAHSTQEQLAISVTEVLKSNTSLINSVKVGSASLGTDDMNGQILLLNAVKDVTSALSDLINQTKTTSGNPNDDTCNENLKSSAKHMVGTLTALLKTVRSVEDEASRGARALESTVEAIKQAVINFHADGNLKQASPEELIRSTKGVTIATAKAIAAASSVRQADIIEAANLGRKQCIELIDTAKAATTGCESDVVREAIIVKVKETAQSYCGVLEHVLKITNKSTDPSKVQLQPLSKKVAVAVSDLVKEAEQLKGVDLVNPEDPNVIAENELLGAASAIEAAARKLAELKPREKQREADESLNFEEQILEAAKAITSAAHTLVKSASIAQRELVSTGRVCSTDSDHYADTQWSQGLISAARLVAEATSALCEAANAAVLGNASQDKLVASAQAVSSSTAQLLLACRVKADPNSKAQKGLQHAGTAVKRASDSLVKAAQEAAIFDIDEVDYRPRESDRVLFIDELNAQEAILKQERALEKARKKLEAIRSERYRNRKQDESGVKKNED